MEAWSQTLLALLEKLDIGEAEAVQSAFRQAYSEPHRRYHTLEHINHLLSELRKAVPNPSEALLLAALYHDYVYDTNRQDNEDKSAEALRHLLERNEAPPALVSKVGELIRATKHSGSTDRFDDETKVLLDADMAVLAESPQNYDLYVSRVRQEFSQVSEPVWRHHRLRFLMSCLESTAIFLSAHFSTYERQARANIAREALAIIAQYEAGQKTD